MTVREEAQKRLDNLTAAIDRDRQRIGELIRELAEVQEEYGERVEQALRTERWITRHDAWVAAGRPQGPRHETGRPEPWSAS